MKIKLAPSILSADFSRLGEQIAAAESAGADYIHVDVMDGHFVPNITIGAQVVKAIRPGCNVPLDVHLMIEDPLRHMPHFVNAGADIVTVHAEACTHLHRTLQSIREKGVKAGVSLNPATPIWVLQEVLSLVDLVLIMTVNPGFGGQPFLVEMLDKIARMRKMLDEAQSSAELEVDGGVTAGNAGDVVRAGGRVLVAGAAVFRSGEGIAAAMQKIRENACSN